MAIATRAVAAAASASRSSTARALSSSSASSLSPGSRRHVHAHAHARIGNNKTKTSVVSSQLNKHKRNVSAAAGMNDLLRMMMADKLQMVSESAALPGRDAEMQIMDAHFVLNGNPIKGVPDGCEEIVFGNGCFWGTEKAFWRIPGVFSTAVGYCGGYSKNPTYEEVCSGQTGHNEVCRVVYDPSEISFVDLLRLFWQSHDPTQGMGQGNDMGTQYRSGIYCCTPEQKALAESSKDAYGKALVGRGFGPITTEIVDCPTFYYAEDYHQQYLAKPGARPYCSAQPSGVSLPPYAEWKPTGEQYEAYTPKLPEAYWDKHAPRPGCTIGFPNKPVSLAEL